MSQSLWLPSHEKIKSAHLTKFMQQAGKESYSDLYDWSVNDLESFWKSVWDYCGIISKTRGNVVIEEPGSMEKSRFFPDARLNYAENLLRQRGNGTAVIFWGEDTVKTRLTHDELRKQVASLAGALRKAGVKKKDRVAGFVPNTPQTLVAMLATASIGAVWSSCSPDFGVQGVLDRFQQIEPKILFSSSGYFYNGKVFECNEKLQKIVPQLPSLEKIVVFDYAPAAEVDLDKLIHMDDFMAGQEDATLTFESVPFDHPLFIMFSSGTTGKPKCIVHSVGGTLLQHLKEHQLHCDIRPGDKLFYFTTCGWMMWNWLVSGLASGATLLLYDGSPIHPSGEILFDYADAEQMTLFGTAAKYIDAIRKSGIEPIKTHKLTSLRMMASTGSPLVPEAYDFVYKSIKKDICLASISGGTDIISCFALGNPIAPVWRGEIQTRGLGMKVQVFNQQGQSIRGEKGELVCTAPFPSMPIGFWNDPDGELYHKAYFSKYENVWHHGDFVEITEHDGLIIYGRSDAVLNPGGVRIGTAEIYRQVELMDEVLESVAVGQEWEGDVRIVLFVKLRPELKLTDGLIKTIKNQLRLHVSPRHVPAKIIQVPDIPRTISGKIVELAVKEIIHNRPVKNMESLANPEALEYYKNLPEMEIA